MQYKQIAVLWKKEDDNNEPHYGGELDFGAFGRVRVAVYLAKDKGQPHDPDATLHVQVQEYEE